MTRLLLSLGAMLLLAFLMLTVVMTWIGKTLSGEGQFLYTVNSIDGAVLYSVDIERRLPAQLNDDLIANMPIFPSPDGQRIAFFAVNDLFSGELVVATLDGTPIGHFDNLSPTDGISWLPDSQHLILVSRLNGEISLLNPIDGSRTVQNMPAIEGWQTFAVSPDGQYLAFDSIF
jgi:hypothetical protein